MNNKYKADASKGAEELNLKLDYAEKEQRQAQIVDNNVNNPFTFCQAQSQILKTEKKDINPATKQYKTLQQSFILTTDDQSDQSASQRNLLQRSFLLSLAQYIFNQVDLISIYKLVFIVIVLHALSQLISYRHFIISKDQESNFIKKEAIPIRIANLLLVILASNLILGYFEANAADYYVRASSSWDEVCSLQNPCRIMDAQSYAIINMNSTGTHTVYIMDDPFLNCSAILHKAQTTEICYFTRHLTLNYTTVYPSITFSHIGRFVVEQGILQFTQIDLKLYSGDSQYPFCINGVGSSAQIRLQQCKSSMRTPSTQSSRGLIELKTSAQCTFSTNYNALAIDLGPNSLIHLDTTAKLDLQNAVIENVTRSQGNGAVIQAELASSSNVMNLKNITFRRCSVNNISSFGGALYIKVNKTNKATYSMESITYDGCDARYGKALFIESDDFIDIVTRSNSTEAKLKVGNNPDPSDEYQMMGFDTLPWKYVYPVLYMWTNVKNEVSHVSNASVGSYAYGTGVDIEICGRVRFPCSSISYAIGRSVLELPSRNTQKIGIVSGFVLKEQVYFNYPSNTLYIQNSLNKETEEVETESLSTLIVNDSNFLVNQGGIQFLRINFTLYQFPGHVIQGGGAYVTNIGISNCVVCMRSGTSTTSAGFVSMSFGNLNIDGLQFKNIVMSQYSVITMNSGVGNLNIQNCNFDDVKGSLQAQFKASILEADNINRNNKISVIENCTIINAVLNNTSTQANLSPIYLTIGPGSTTTMKQVSITGCKGQNGGAVYAQIGDTAKLEIFDGCIFTNTQADTNGGAIWASLAENAQIRVSSAVFDTCSSQLGGCIYIKTVSSSKLLIDTNTTINQSEAKLDKGGAIYADLSLGGILQIEQSIKFSNCQTSGTNQDLHGGAIYANVGASGQVLISAFCEFTNCKCAQGSGGAIYALLNGSSSKLEIKDNVKFTNCSCSREGGAICIPDSNVSSNINLNKIMIKDCTASAGGGIWVRINAGAIATLANYSSFTNCSSSSTTASGGGGLYSVVNGAGSKLTISDNIEFNKCTSKYHGGAVYIDSVTEQDVTISNCMIDECQAENQGGGAYIKSNLGANNKLRIINTYFRLCESKQEGGGLFADISTTTGQFVISSNSQFDQCKSTSKGGAIFIKSIQYKTIKLTETIFNHCSSQQGGGISLDLNNGDEFIIADSSSFTNCSTNVANGLGGGLYAIVLNTNKFSITNIVLFNNCSSNSSGGGAYIDMHTNGIVLLHQSNQELEEITNCPVVVEISANNPPPSYF
ncbi:MAG: hypothetical protein EZS28_025823, partial [Streblomastix strix]